MFMHIKAIFIKDFNYLLLMRKSGPVIKVIVYPKTKMMSSFFHPLIIWNLYDFRSSKEHKRRNAEECWQPNSAATH